MKHKILLVDDEPGILKSLERLLRRDGYEILKAEGGEQAIEMIEEHEDLALIISDQRMPGMNGAQVLARAVELRPDTVRIALTGYGDASAILACINRGQVSRFLLKPWDDDSLRQTVRDSVNSYWMKTENQRLEMLNCNQTIELQELNSALEKKVQERTQELEQAKERVANSLSNFQAVLVRLMEMHDPGLRGHGRRVADMSKRLAEEVDCSPVQVEAIESAALLHDTICGG